jgi:hypothetical protein
VAVFNKFNTFTLDMAHKVHNLSADALKVMLTDVAPVATNTIKANITEIAAGNGYVAGGVAASFVSDGQVSGTYKLVIGQPLFTASGGNIAQFRYQVLYNSTAASGNLIGWIDNGAEVNVTNGNSFQVQFDQTNGVLTNT